jgi:hypothetical protein
MSEQKPIESIIAADIGSTLTHVCLIDLVDGVFRLVAHAEANSTLAHPESDVMLGLRRAIKQMEHIVQRPLLDQNGDLISPEQESGSGVDCFVATSNAAPPLQCAIIGLTDSLSVESAQRACLTANALVTQTISLGMRMRRWDEDTLAALHKTPPDLILLVGGIDTGPIGLLESAARVLVTLYDDLEPEQRPAIIFAGNQEARRPISAIVTPYFDLRVVDNVRPNVQRESLGELQRELAEVYEKVKLATLPGYRRLRQWCAAPILSTTEALSNTWRFIARRNDLSQGVLGIDIGGATTHIAASRGDLYQWAIGAGLGSGFGIGRVLELSSVDDVWRWLPVSMSREQVLDHLENAHLRPHSIPQTMEDLLLTHAVVRQALLLAMRPMRQQYWYRTGYDPAQQTTPPFDLLAARGGTLAHTPQDGVVTLTLLDAVQPVGLTRLVVDWASIWAQLGVVALVSPLAAAQVLERDSFRELGTVIAPLGDARDGERALHLKIMRENGPTTEADIPAGTIQRFPLALNEYAILEVRPSRAFDIGLGRKGMGGKSRVRGGSLGIIVDTRGRPLGLLQDAQQRQAKSQQWLGNLISDVNRPS